MDPVQKVFVLILVVLVVIGGALWLLERLNKPKGDHRSRSAYSYTNESNGKQWGLTVLVIIAIVAFVFFAFVLPLLSGGFGGVKF